MNELFSNNFHAFLLFYSLKLAEKEYQEEKAKVPYFSLFFSSFFSSHFSFALKYTLKYTFFLLFFLRNELYLQIWEIHLQLKNWLYLRNLAVPTPNSKYGIGLCAAFQRHSHLFCKMMILVTLKSTLIWSLLKLFATI